MFSLFSFLVGSRSGIVRVRFLALGLFTAWWLAMGSESTWSAEPAASTRGPLGEVGKRAAYRRGDAGSSAPNSLHRVELTLGPVEAHNGVPSQWIMLHWTKLNGEELTAWLLTQGTVARELETASTKAVRYVVREGSGRPREYVHQTTDRALLPGLGAWSDLWPRPTTGTFREGVVADEIELLGVRLMLERASDAAPFELPVEATRLRLRPDMLLGLPSNTRTVESTRRFDGSEYAMTRLTREDYREMIASGMNCVRVDAAQLPWIEDEPVFYWGIGGADVRFPECLYRSHYLGMSLFLDEPAVGTRDHDVRPRLAKEPLFRRELSPERMFEIFREHYAKSVRQGGPVALMNSLRGRTDIELGSMRLIQRNLYSWETMVSTAAWQLTAEPEGGPAAMVFEPPGRFGTRRTVPEMNMTYGCQLPPLNPSSLADPVFGFLRGAARAAGKRWGVSIYGAVNPDDAPFLLTHAYDLGATHFFFWDNYQLACVPFAECLALSRRLRDHAARHPERDLEVLRTAATVLIRIPAGYDLGHVQMGRGNLWGIAELNLERRNAHGVPYRRVMSNLFIEIERCLRLGTPFDVAWDLPAVSDAGYREVVRIRDDGRVQVTEGRRSRMLASARVPERASGVAPALRVELDGSLDHAPCRLEARAFVTEGSSTVYYTTGSDRTGVHPNARVIWELYGPLDEDYRTLLDPGARPGTRREGGTWVVSHTFGVATPGRYRLRAATTDRDGRSAVVWKTFEVRP